MSKFTVSKVRDEDGEVIEATYEYRGVQFYRDDRVSPGYWGRYSISISKNAPFMRDASSQADVKNIIDRYLEWKAAQ